MVDIHSHVVWGLDDGATCMEQSLGMLKAAAESNWSLRKYLSMRTGLAFLKIQ